MSICLSHLTAMEYYSRLRVADGFCLDRSIPSVAERMKRAGAVPPNADLADRFLPDHGRAERLLSGELKGLTPPLHVLVTDRGKANSNRLTRCHLWSNRMPRSAFFRAAPNLPDLYLVSPAVMLFQLARDLSFERLVQLLHEACGTYATPFLSSSGHDSCAPLVSLRSLKQFAAGVCDLRGGPSFAKALDWVIAPSASPMETVAVMLLCLPRRYGGYGLPLPRANHPLEIPVRAGHRDGRNVWTARDGYDRYGCGGYGGSGAGYPQGRTGGRTRVYGDLFWPEADIVLEYDGRLSHRGSEKVSKDYARCNALESAGVTVLTISAAQLKSVDQLDRVARRIADGLGFRLRKRDYDECWMERHRGLRATLLPPGKACAAPWCGELLGEVRA